MILLVKILVDLNYTQQGKIPCLYLQSYRDTIVASITYVQIAHKFIFEQYINNLCYPRFMNRFSLTKLFYLFTIW